MARSFSIRQVGVHPKRLRTSTLVSLIALHMWSHVVYLWSHWFRGHALVFLFSIVHFPACNDMFPSVHSTSFVHIFNSILYEQQPWLDVPKSSVSYPSLFSSKNKIFLRVIYKWSYFNQWFKLTSENCIHISPNIWMKSTICTLCLTNVLRLSLCNSTKYSINTKSNLY